MGGSILMQRKIRCRKFPSPHSGILFLCENRRVPPGGKTGRVSVPSFGDSFFMGGSILMQRKIRCRKFPSPHSGILFLCENRRVPPGGKTGRVSVPSFGDSFFMPHIPQHQGEIVRSFRPLIRGFFFYT